MTSEIKKHVFRYNGPFALWYRKFIWKTCGFHKFGQLFHDASINESTAEGSEAIRRLPPHLYDARIFRIMRATQLIHNHEQLPKEQWTKYEDETWYLAPYLEEVYKELNAAKKWNGIIPAWKRQWEEDTFGNHDLDAWSKKEQANN